MTFIPKGETDGQSASISRQAQELRPLNLSNTDNKIIALILNDKLAELAQLIVSGQQRGFIKGRHIDDNILQLEAAAIVHSLTNIKRAAMVLFDFSAAFPSVSHRWIFKVLEHMQIPSNIIHAIRELYKNSTASICINNVAYFTIGIYSGIKQGCPLSGTIFALAIDPLLRTIVLHNTFHSITLTAFADDIGISVADLFRILPIVFRIVVLWKKVSALGLNYGKCIIAPLWRGSHAPIRLWLNEMLPAFASVQIEKYAKYLGIYIGPDAHLHQWDSNASILLKRAGDAALRTNGFNDKLRHYRTHGISTILYKAQFAHPNNAMRLAAKRAGQLICSAPWFAIPPDLLHGLRHINMPLEVPNIDIIAKAAQIRLVATSATFNDATSAIDEAYQSEDCILAPPLQRWYKNSIIYTLRATWDAHYKIHNIRPLMTHNQLHGRQRKLYNIIDRKATK